jgi:hypothetical protein
LFVDCHFMISSMLIEHLTLIYHDIGKSFFTALMLIIHDYGVRNKIPEISNSK